MRFVLSLAVVVASFTFSITNVYALEVRSSGAQYEHFVSQIVAEEISPIIDQLPKDQKGHLAQVQIHVVSDLGSNAMALAIDDSPPKILINDHFIQGLAHYVEAYLLAETLQQPEFIEAYFSNYFWTLHPQTVGVTPASPFQLRTDLADQALMIRKRQLLADAVRDVLLHEIGHHAKAAFYHYRASASVRQLHEERAEAWAQRIKQQYFDDLGLGQLISIAYIFEQSRWSLLAADSYYPRFLSAVAGYIPNNCQDSDSAEVLRFCERLEQDIDQLFSGHLAASYLQRIEQGEQFANFPLGQLEWAKSNFVDACYYFNESLVYGQVARAAVFVGWCFQKGYLEPLPPDAEVLALLNEKTGGSFGFSDRIQALALLQ